MSPEVHLIIHNAIGIFSAIVSVTVLIFVVVNDHRRTIGITLAAMIVAVIVFLVSHVWGVSVADPSLSKQILMWNVSVVVICMFNFHCAMAALKREKEQRVLIGIVYAIGTAMIAMFLIAPDTFILSPEPKMYFPNYYVPGTFHWLMRLIFQIIIPVYFVYELIRAYRRTSDIIERNRFLYFAVAFGLGWLFGFIPIPLIFGYQIDPMWGLLFPIFFTIPFTYAVLRYELLDIRVVAKKAFIYGTAIAGTGGLIAFFNFSNQWMQSIYPGFPFWITPLFSALIVIAISLVIWKQLRESDILKYEFVTTVTHKFRTPLTHIKWATENLKTAQDREDIEAQIGYIESSTAKLVELTDVLANTSEATDQVYQYRLERNNFSTFAEEVASVTENHATSNKIRIVREIPPGMFAIFDSGRLRFVLQTLIENAINYTPEGGTVTVKVYQKDKNIICSVKDTGIGIPKPELQLIFTKLYRGRRARSVDTEGMGIGLFISKSIISRHHGKLWVESEGENRGSTFSFSLPLAK